MTLTEKAKTHKFKDRATRNPTQDEIDLAIAWAKDEITYSQASFAVTEGRSQMQVYVLIARALRQAFREGKITTKP